MTDQVLTHVEEVKLVLYYFNFYVLR